MNFHEIDTINKQYGKVILKMLKEIKKINNTLKLKEAELKRLINERDTRTNEILYNIIKEARK